MRWRLSVLLCLALLAACAPATRVDKPEVVTVPSDADRPGESGGLAQGVVARINRLRASGHDCGSGFRGRLAPLSPHAALDRAARLHNEDMARTGRISHQGSNGQGLQARLERVGYRWSYRGENIASFRSIDAAFAFWLSSGAHCRNLMNPNYQDIGVSVVQTEPEQFYLTLVFGRPR